MGRWVPGIFTRATALLLLLIGIAPGLSGAADRGGHALLRIGVISLKTEKRLKEYAPLAAYLSKKLRTAGIERAEVIVTRDIDGMNRLIREGGIDLTVESAFPAIELERHGMVPSLLAWRKGVREYRTVFVVRKDSGISTLSDLRGKTIAFEDPRSTSAYAVPLVELKKNGLKPAPAGTDNKVSEDGVGYYFAGEALNESYWVAQGKSHAAAISNNDWESLPPAVRAELRIIHETTPILRYIVSFNSALPGPVKRELEKALLQMDNDPAGTAALESASEIRKIERFRAEDLRSLEYVRSLLNYPE